MAQLGQVLAAEGAAGARGRPGNRTPAIRGRALSITTLPLNALPRHDATIATLRVAGIPPSEAPNSGLYTYSHGARVPLDKQQLYFTGRP